MEKAYYKQMDEFLPQSPTKDCIVISFHYPQRFRAVGLLDVA